MSRKASLKSLSTGTRLPESELEVIVMIRKNLMKTLTIVMAAMLAVMTVACGAQTEGASDVAAVEETEQDSELEESMVRSVAGSSEEAGKVETVYVAADANGAVNDVIVSEWLKNADAADTISDTTGLHNIVNVKGSETYKDNGDGTVTWDAKGADIYYQGTTEKELPVKMKISYKLDGKDISPEELAGKSGKVTIRFDYENKDKQTVEVNGKEISVYTPFAMISGMTLDADKFSDVEVSNGKVISDGGNIVVMGIALPGLKDSLDIDQDKWDEIADDSDLDNKLSDHFEINAYTTDCEIGMTITMASSDVLSDFGVTDLSGSGKIDELKDDMTELNDGSDKLVDGSKELKDGTSELRNGVGELYDGTTELHKGTADFYSGLVEYTNATTKIKDGASALAEGAQSAKDGSHKMKKAMDEAKLVENAKALSDGAAQVSEGVNQVAAMAQSLSGLSSSVEELSGKKAAFDATAAWIENGGDCSPVVVACLNQLSGGQITSAEAATGWRNASLQAISELNKLGGYTVTATMEPNDGEAPTIEGEEGTLSRDGDTGSGSESGSGTGSGSGSGEGTGSGSDTGSGTGSESGSRSGEDNSGFGNGSGSGSGTEGSGSGEGAGAEGSGSGGNSGTEGGNTVGGSSTEGSGSGSEGSGSGEGAGNTEGSGSGTEGNNSNVPGSEGVPGAVSGVGGTGAAGGSGVGAAQVLLDNKMIQPQTVNNSMMRLYSANPEGESKSYADGEIAGYVQRAQSFYSILGAAKSASNTLGTVLEAMSGATQGAGLSGDTTKSLQQLVAGAKMVADGNKALAGGIEELYGGTVKLDEGLGKLSDGATELSNGTGTLVSNNDKLVDGAYQLNDGAGKLNDGVNELKDGTIKLDDGVQELVDGMVKFDEEGIDKLYEAFDGDLTEFTDKLTAIREAGSNYTTFGGAADDIDSSVKFIIKTEGIKEV